MGRELEVGEEISGANGAPGTGRAQDYFVPAADVHERRYELYQPEVDFISCRNERLLVSVDDADLPLGQTRLVGRWAAAAGIMAINPPEAAVGQPDISAATSLGSGGGESDGRQTLITLSGPVYGGGTGVGEQSVGAGGRASGLLAARGYGRSDESI